jgi:hypothetical protein
MAVGLTRQLACVVHVQKEGQCLARGFNAWNLGQRMGAHAVVYGGFGACPRIIEMRSIEWGEDCNIPILIL